MIPQSHSEVVGGVQKNGVVGDLGSAAVSDGLQQQRPLVLLLASGEPELSPEPLKLLQGRAHHRRHLLWERSELVVIVAAVGVF